MSWSDIGSAALVVLGTAVTSVIYLALASWALREREKSASPKRGDRAANPKPPGETDA